ncbi:unnamed protein product [Lota lota]
MILLTRSTVLLPGRPESRVGNRSLPAGRRGACITGGSAVWCPVHVCSTYERGAGLRSTRPSSSVLTGHLRVSSRRSREPSPRPEARPGGLRRTDAPLTARHPVVSPGRS